jgi:uncharacterized alkaline shock family protein YloU
MEVYALVGPSGTGKSHRAIKFAHQLDAQAIIDDGLLIQRHSIIAGSSAKQQPTRLAAIKAAIFLDDKQADIMKRAIDELKIERILLLGTSTKMVEQIASRLKLPKPSKVINITEVASEKDIRRAKLLRTRYNKHVIPAPILEVKKSFPNALIDPLKVFFKKKGSPPGRRDWIEQSMVRPPFTYNGRITISNGALSNITEIAANSILGVSKISKIENDIDQDGIVTINISIIISFGHNITLVSRQIQNKIKQSVEEMTGLQVKSVNIQIKSLSFEHKTTGATI